MEMRSTFHLKFHMHCFKATLFQYGENKKYFDGSVIWKKILNPQRNKRMCGHGNIKSLVFHKKKKAASAVSTFLFVIRKRKVGSQSSHWPRSENICWSHE